MKEIIHSIKDGFWNAYREYETFRPPDSDFPTKITEYLFTVNVARALNEQFPRKGSCGIFVEYPYLQFLQLAKSKYITENILKMEKDVTRKERNKYRNKSRIDIVFQGRAIGPQYTEDVSNFAIELKGINPPSNKVKADLERLKYALLVKNKEGKNYISQCYCAYLKRIDSMKKVYDGKDKTREVEKYNKKLDEILKILFKGSKIDYKIKIKDFDATKLKDYLSGYPEEDLSEEGAKGKTGCIMSVIISLKKADERP